MTSGSDDDCPPFAVEDARPTPNWALSAAGRLDHALPGLPIGLLLPADPGQNDRLGGATGRIARGCSAVSCIVSVIGYTYCLDPATGNQIWFNELKGFGAGVAALASVRGCVQPLLDAAAADEEARRRSSD